MPIKKMNNGTYKVDVSLGVSQTSNKRARTTRRGIKTLKEAKNIERELLNENDNNKNMIDVKTKVVIKDYLNYSSLNDKPSSHLKKQNVFKNYIIPFFNDFKINEITSVRARQFKESLISLYISNNYKRYIIAMMSSFLNYAVKYNYINKNPMKQIDNFKKEKVTMQYWTLSEFNTFIEQVDEIIYKTIFWILYYTGMRKGELLGLTLEDINFNNKTIDINKSCSYITGQGYIVTTPKTAESKRIIHINEKTIKIIKDYVAYISNQYEFNKKTPLFSINGVLIPKETLRRKFKYYQRLTNVTNIRIHDLRHSHVALLIYLGQDPLTIKKRLGHSDITITYNTYGHLYDDAQKKLASRLDEV